MKNPTALISVIVPVYNTEKYLSECLGSLLNQTYQNLEIILIDDGSTDHSLAIGREKALQDNRIAVYHQEHAGVSAARNFGLEQAKGDFVALIDSDDTVLPRYIEHLYEAIQRFDAALVRTKCLFRGVEDFPCDIQYSSGTYFCNAEQLESIRMLIGISGTLFRREDIAQLRFDRDVYFGEDTLFNLNVLLHSSSRNAVFLSKAEYIYRPREDSACTKRDYQNFKTYRLAIEQMEKLTKGMKMEKSVAELWYFYWQRLFIEVALSKTADPNERRETRQKLIALRKKGIKPPFKRTGLLELLFLCHGQWLYHLYDRIRKGLVSKKTSSSGG